MTLWSLAWRNVARHRRRSNARTFTAGFFDALF